mmetsp:Transcript_12568/g.27856  ORF Transcript_12568/g.27856 Transcript_12568/m.27856 type:complete len:89 (-) Transcript_12568:43-309(-)
MEANLLGFEPDEDGRAERVADAARMIFYVLVGTTIGAYVGAVGLGTTAAVATGSLVMCQASSVLFFLEMRENRKERALAKKKRARRVP